MKKLVLLSLEYPKQVLAGLFVITAILGTVLFVNFEIEINPSKSFSRDLNVIKFYNLTLKKFSMKDMILIGIENEKDGIFNVETLRYIEKVTDRIVNLKVEKSYENIFSGKEESVQVSSEISGDGIISVIDADDVTVDKSSNTVVVGNLTGKARNKAGLIAKDESEMLKLPKDDKDLEKLIPYLREEFRKNKLFKGTIVSKDEKACAIIVPVKKNLDNKIEILRKELYTMIDSDELKKRFSGRNYYFPHNIYDKTVNGTTVNDEYINEISLDNREKLKSFFVDLFEDVDDEFKEFYSFIKENEISDEYIDRVFSMIESDELYENKSYNKSYEDVVDGVYEFAIKNMDEFSRNNIESTVYSLKDIVDVGHLYELLEEQVGKKRPESISTYIAGMPIASAQIANFIINDMSVFLNGTVIVIILILFLSFRTVRGVMLPLSCVGISTVWVMSFLVMAGFKITSGTIPLPTLLIAVGSAYIIHYISKYFEEIFDNGKTDIKTAIIDATDKVELAINLAAITTIAAFMSVISSAGVIDVKLLGILTSIGIIVTVILTYSFVPAMLILMRLPRRRIDSKAEEALQRLILRGGEFTHKHSKFVFFLVLFFTILAGSGIYFLKTESSITYFFKKDNPIRVSSNFIDRKLTGTGQMSIVFKMRDRVNISSVKAQEELSARIDNYTDSFNKLVNRYPEMKGAPGIYNYFTKDINKLKGSLVDSQDVLEAKIAIFGDVLNEYFEIKQEKVSSMDETSAGEGDDFDISALADSSSLASDSAVSPVDEGITDIIKRIGIDSGTETDKSKKFIKAIRNYKSTEPGKVFMGSFNLLADFFHTDIKQPITLKKIDAIGTRLIELDEPRAYIDGKSVKPVGKTLSITDSLKLIYKVFYHDDNEKFNKLPDVKKDGFKDKSLTDRRIVGICIDQFSGSSPEIFKSMATSDLKYLQFQVFTRSDKAKFLRNFNDAFFKIAGEYFPEDDPYVEKIAISGLAAINMRMNNMLFDQQLQSILITIGVVFIVCFFIFRSFAGGLLSIVPITCTVIINLGIMGWLDFPITYGTVIIASIAIGAGIDYTIHFVERFKYEHIVKGDDFKLAYHNTLKSTGMAIVISAVSVAAGFGVLMLSTFKMLSTSGLMVGLAMLLSATASLTVLPALMNWLKPEFLEKQTASGD